MMKDQSFMTISFHGTNGVDRTTVGSERMHRLRGMPQSLLSVGLLSRWAARSKVGAENAW
jgi:hypothetical protein